MTAEQLCFEKIQPTSQLSGFPIKYLEHSIFLYMLLVVRPGPFMVAHRYQGVNVRYILKHCG